MGSDWRWTTLGEICSSQGGAIQTGPFGSQLHASDYVEAGIPVVMPANLGDNGIEEDGIARIRAEDADRLAQHKLNLGDVVFSRRGDVTRNALIRPREVGWLCGTGCLKVRLGDESTAKAKFITYCLRLPEIKEWLVRHAVGATMPNLNTAILSAVPVFLPPVVIQDETASTLGAIDNKITLLRETNATLEAIAQAIFKSWFVDFELVRSKAEGRDPEGVPPEVADLFPSEFEDSKLGAIPKGWRAMPFLEAIEVIGGGTPKTSIEAYWNGDIPWFSVVDAPRDGDVFVLDTEKHITAEGVANSSTRVLRPGTTIISARGTVGNTALVGREMAMNQSCYGLQGRRIGDAQTYFSTRHLVSVLQQRSHGSVFETITRDTLSSVSVVVAPPKISDSFENYVGTLLRQVRNNVSKASILV